MTRKITKDRKSAVRRAIMALGASAMAMAITTAGHAEAARGEPAPARDEAPVDPLATDEIVVTGSRIARPGFDTVRPIQAVSSEDIEARAFVNIGDALAELPAVKAAVPGDQDQFVLGQSFVDLFGLGSQRTLTLVNGRRFVSSNPSAAAVTSSIDAGLQVDYGAIPSVLVKRIEVAKLAGAAVYGSDAIAGTINIVLRDDFEGLDVSGQYGLSDHGDLGQYQLSAVAGFAVGERGNIVVAAEYDRSDSARYSARPRFSRDTPQVAAFGSTLDIDGDGDRDTEYRIYDGRRFSYYSEYGAVAPVANLVGVPGLFLPSFTLPGVVPPVGRLVDGKFYRFDSGGTLTTCTPGRALDGLVSIADYGGNCGSNLFDSLTLRPEVKRLNLALLGHYDVTDGVRLSLEGLYSDVRAIEPSNSFLANAALIGGTSSAFVMRTDNPFLSDQARAILQANGLTSFALNRESDDLIDDGALRGRSRTWRIAGGLSGDFEWGARRFQWDVSAVVGAADIATSQTNINNARLAAAVNAVRNSSGQIVCAVNADASSTNDMPGCLPLNIFGDARVLNSREALDYIQGDEPTRTDAENRQRVFTASLTGDLVKLPAGWIKANIGAETRRERNSFIPGLGFISGNNRLPAIGATGGALETMEAFGEVVVPITSANMDIPFAHMLEVSGSVRFVHDKARSMDGSQKSKNDATVYEFGARWSPVRDIVLRGSYTSAIRSPALTELFRQDQAQFAFGLDPCDYRNVNNGPAPATRRANCIAAGLNPDSFTSNLGGGGLNGRASGNPDLVPERSKSFNIGAVIQPRWLSRFALSVDYYDIRIRDRITQLDLSEILASCYDDPGYPASVFCNDDLFRRSPANGNISFARVRPFNASDARYRAVEGRLAWSAKLAELLSAHGDLGAVSFDLSVLRQITSTIDISGNVEGINQVGSFAAPRWSGTFSATYALGPMRLFWRTVWQDAPKFSVNDDAFISRFGPGEEAQAASVGDILQDGIGGRVIHNASLQFDIRDGFKFQVGVDNLFARKPSRVEQAAGFFGQDELYGRRYTARVQAKF